MPIYSGGAGSGSGSSDVGIDSLAGSSFDWQGGMEAGGAILNGVGGLISGLSENDAFNYNAGVLEDQANQVMISEGFSETQFGKQEDSYLSHLKAEYAAAGVTQVGSPTDVALNSAANFELDKLTMKYNAEVKAGGLRSEAGMQRYYGKEAKNEGMGKLGSSLLSAGRAFL